jgi:hypothetical protein
MAITQVKEGGLDITNAGSDGQFLKKAGTQFTWDTVDTSIADESITLAKLEHGDGTSNGKFLRSNNGADPTWETVTSADTTYSISCVDGDNTDEEKIRLTAGGSGSGTDDVVLEAGTGLSIARSGDKITYTNTASSPGGASGLDLNDNVKIRWGTGNDWSSYYDGNHLILKDEGVTAGEFQVLQKNGHFKVSSIGRIDHKTDWTAGTNATTEPSGACATFYGKTNTASSGSGDCNSYIAVEGTNGANSPGAYFGCGRKTEYGHADIGWLSLRGVRQYGSNGCMKWTAPTLDSGSVYTYNGSQYQGFEVYNYQSNNQRCFTINWESYGNGDGNNNHLLHLRDARSTTNSNVKLLYATSVSGGTFYVEQDGDCKNTNNSYGSASDEKLKQDIADATSQWDDIKNIRVRKFKWKAAPEKGYMLGVIAQEVEKISPGLIKEDNDQVDEIDENGTRVHKFTGEKTKTAKYSILYMKAIKALQEAMARIETLEAKVAALESS